MQVNGIYLTGYFDRNFGDDMMMKLVVRSFPDLTFVVEDTADTPLLSEPNLRQAPRRLCEALPRLVVTGSGFMINTPAAFKTELLWFLKGRHPGDYCLGCNIEPLDHPIKTFLISRKLNQFKLITCRDQASYCWLRRHTRKPQVHCLPDLLFSLPEAWLPAAKNPEMLGISLLHRTDDQESCPYYRAMAEAADAWIRETGKGVLLMAFDTGKEDDLFACRAVQALMQTPDRAEIVVHRDGTEIPAAFALCKKVVAARFHAIILALRMGIPVYPLAYREKTRNSLKDIQYPYPVYDLDAIDNASLLAFVRSEQTPYPLEQDIHKRAGEHIQLLKQRLATQQF